ncbi:MAG: NADH-quinone oxidoreductase subunit C [Bacteroidota bacterium]|nr:NADH-quinone oxidoreductase subunit C [Bacteroidota bacterium]
MAITKDEIINSLTEVKPNILFETNEHRDELTIIINKKDILELCKFLKEDIELEFKLLEDIAGVDWARRKNRFSVIYHLFSLRHNFRISVKTDVDECDCSIDSISSVFKVANWQEREVYDMFGISFNNHPDLRRMYMPEEFEYYPLRKEFPLMGIPGSNPIPKK